MFKDKKGDWKSTDTINKLGESSKFLCSIYFFI
jgi:hypothetical protein